MIRIWLIEDDSYDHGLQEAKSRMHLIYRACFNGPKLLSCSGHCFISAKTAYWVDSCMMCILFIYKTNDRLILAQYLIEGCMVGLLCMEMVCSDIQQCQQQCHKEDNAVMTLCYTWINDTFCTAVTCLILNKLCIDIT